MAKHSGAQLDLTPFSSPEVWSMNCVALYWDKHIVGWDKHTQAFMKFCIFTILGMLYYLQPTLVVETFVGPIIHNSGVSGSYQLWKRSKVPPNCNFQNIIFCMNQPSNLLRSWCLLVWTDWSLLSWLLGSSVEGQWAFFYLDVWV